MKCYESFNCVRHSGLSDGQQRRTMQGLNMMNKWSREKQYWKRKYIYVFDIEEIRKKKSEGILSTKKKSKKTIWALIAHQCQIRLTEYYFFIKKLANCINPIRNCYSLPAVSNRYKRVVQDCLSHLFIYSQQLIISQEIMY